MRLIFPLSSMPATDCTMLTSSASAGESGGKMPGRHAASRLLPDPGGPLMSRLCPPAAAISSARRAVSCPLTCARSGPCPPAATSPASGSGNCPSPLRCAISVTRSGAAQMLIPLAQRASAPCEAGQISPFSRSLACNAASRTPGEATTRPSSASSPTATHSDNSSTSSTPIAASRASAMGRS